MKAICRTSIFLSLFLSAAAVSAFAQSTVSVTQDQSTIWTRDFESPAAVVDAGTVLTVVGQRKDWYEVVVPGSDTANGTVTGFIYKRLVKAAEERTPSIDNGWQTSISSGSERSDHGVGLFGFAQFGYARFAAQNTFQAIFGNAGGAFFGGGGEVRLGPNVFVNVAVERFKKTGQRVVVVGSQVFGLGIPDTVTLTPIVGTAGWRFAHEHVTPYFGGGIGKVLYKEESGFADDGENIDTRFTRYHVLGGIEVRNNWVATAFEVEYARVPDAIGVGGASAAFDESNLGGIVGRIRVLIGR
jgi:hypothetical protein